MSGPTSILALDQGTTGSTALVFNEAGDLLGKGYREITQHYPHPGWVEHDPEEIWSATIQAAREALDRASMAGARIGAIGITNQRETTIVWDRKTSRPIHRAIVWQCRRTSETCERLKKARLEPKVRKATGLLLDPYFSATKVSWILDQVPGARRRAQSGELAFGTVDSWLLWKLTEGKTHATDFTNASRTLLFDIHRKTWSPELLKIFRVPKAVLPDVRRSSGDFGVTEAGLFGAPIPIRGIAGDQQAALFGHFAVASGQAKCTFGTGAFALAFLGKRSVLSKHGLLTTLVCGADGAPAYGLEGSVFMAGAIIQWLRDGLKILSSAGESETLARSVQDTGGVVLVPAFVGLGAPHWDARARGAIFGMTRGTERAHIVRAALEAIAHQTDDLLTAMGSDMGRRLKELRVDGGAVSNRFLMEHLSDITGVRVVRPHMVELTAFGAARLAAITLGLWTKSPPGGKDYEPFGPKISKSSRTKMRERWKAAVGACRSFS